MPNYTFKQTRCYIHALTSFPTQQQRSSQGEEREAASASRARARRGAPAHRDGAPPQADADSWATPGCPALGIHGGGRQPSADARHAGARVDRGAAERSRGSCAVCFLPHAAGPASCVGFASPSLPLAPTNAAHPTSILRALQIEPSPTTGLTTVIPALFAHQHQQQPVHQHQQQPVVLVHKKPPAAQAPPRASMPPPAPPKMHVASLPSEVRRAMGVKSDLGLAGWQQAAFLDLCVHAFCSLARPAPPRTLPQHAA